MDRSLKNKPLTLKGCILSIALSSVASLSLVFLSGFSSQIAPWEYRPSHLLFSVVFAAALFVALFMVWSKMFRAVSKGLKWSVLRVLAISIVVCFPVVVLILLAISGYGTGRPIKFSPDILLLMLIVFFGLLVLNSLPLSKIVLLALNVIVLLFAVMPSTQPLARSSLQKIVSGEEKMFANNIDYVGGSVHDLMVRNYDLFGRKLPIAGGGVEVVDGNRLLLVTGEGEIKLVGIGQDKATLESKSHRSPFDRSVYTESAENPSKYFRVTDALLEGDESGERKLFVSYHHWDEQNRCASLKVSEATLNIEKFGDTALEWSELFTSSPCLDSTEFYNTTGGRMGLLGNSLLLTVGTTTWWGYKAEDVKGDYGKIVEINLDDKTSSVFTSGHRNPQGLTVFDDQIWSTEHGPEGGDELNLITKGKDYGWPMVTYGTDYGHKEWWGNDNPGDHDQGERPIYSWVPSIGISSLIRIKGNAFENWSGDLMVSSLYGNQGHGSSLFRVKLFNNRVVLVERFLTRKPIRDLVELPDGRLVLWDGLQFFQVLQPVNTLFSACSGCHTLSAGFQGGIGPDIDNVVGASVARYRDFQYSDAMKEFGGKWTKARLDKFLEDPNGVVPGTTMNMPGIKDEAERRAIVDFLSKRR